MHEAGHSGNGAAHEEHSLANYGRRIQHDAHALSATVHDATAGLEGYVTAQATRRPYTTVGIAAGVGYALGGGLSSWLTVALFGTVTRLAMAMAARELGARVSPNGPVGATKERS
jgi:hypothetical protein